MSSASPHRETARAELLNALRVAVGRRHVLTDPQRTRRYRTGFRFGGGAALALVRPATLVELWRTVQACVAADCIVIMQAANTGLTGGSTPDGDDYDRDVVIVNTLRLNKIQLLDGGRQVICLPGATLDQLEKLLKPLGRAPHSVIGSSCIGASVFGGVCNNSGGALVQRGPAYTEMALYAQRDASGALQLVNHLGIELGKDPELMLEWLEHGNYSEADIEPNAGAGSDRDYAQHVRAIDADTPARFNADPRRLCEAAGSAGRLAVFALRLDTFPVDTQTAVFYIGSNDTAELGALRRHMLAQFEHLPIAGEYLHRDAFDIAERYGKDTFLTIRWLGTGNLPRFFALKNRCDDWFERLGLPALFSDRVLQVLSRLFPSHLPARMKQFRDRYEHHLLLKVAGPAIAATEEFLEEFFAGKNGAYFRCTADEGDKAFLHRFAAAGAAVRYRTVHGRQVEDIVALDIALRRNDTDWFERLPAELDAQIAHKLYYGHFFCYVFHQDYIVKKGLDCLALEHRLWKLLDERGAEYPAEHNVGHLYHAKPELRAFYRELDPTNTFNPGIGKTSKRKRWSESDQRSLHP